MLKSGLTLNRRETYQAVSVQLVLKGMAINVKVCDILVDPNIFSFSSNIW